LVDAGESNGGSDQIVAPLSRLQLEGLPKRARGDDGDPSIGVQGFLWCVCGKRGEATRSAEFTVGAHGTTPLTKGYRLRPLGHDY